MEDDGKAIANTGETELFVYVAGRQMRWIDRQGEARSQRGHYIVLAAADGISKLRLLQPGTRLLIFQKRFEPLAGTKHAGRFCWRRRENRGPAVSRKFQGAPANITARYARLRYGGEHFRLPTGRDLPFVETHIMEHGLLMLAGAGIYRLDDDWHPVQTGDVIWIAPYCPQWFAAVGDEPASYIYYKDVNRTPILHAH